MTQYEPAGDSITPRIDEEIMKDKQRTAVALSTSETVSRYGSANAEFVKGYAGNDAGKTLSKGLKGISRERTNLENRAGWAAEVAATSRDNAEAIICKSDVRTIRSDDLKYYDIETNRKYREVVDRVRVENGEIVYEAQTKFEKNGNNVAHRITSGSEKEDYRKYFGKNLELPSDQAEEARKFCRQRAESSRKRALIAEQKGKPEVAEALRKRAYKYDQLAELDIVDVGLSRDQVNAYVENPIWETTQDIARTSHRAGKEGAKYGGIIGGSISLLTNAFAVAQNKKSLGDAAKDVAGDTGKAAVLGYVTASTGAAIKGVMQQSSNATLRTLSGTAAPVLALNICLSLGSSITRYVNDEITEAQLLEEIGEKGAGMLSSGMYAALGQLVIPIPFVGAAVGGMIGYTLSSMFYQAALGAAKQADAAKANLARVREIETAAREEIDGQRATLDAFMRKELPELHRQTEQLFAAIDARDVDDVDAFVVAINSYAELLGAELRFKSITEFDTFMDSDEPLRL